MWRRVCGKSPRGSQWALLHNNSCMNIGQYIVDDARRTQTIRDSRTNYVKYVFVNIMRDENISRILLLRTRWKRVLWSLRREYCFRSAVLRARGIHPRGGLTTSNNNKTSAIRVHLRGVRYTIYNNTAITERSGWSVEKENVSNFALARNSVWPGSTNVRFFSFFFFSIQYHNIIVQNATVTTSLAGSPWRGQMSVRWASHNLDRMLRVRAHVSLRLRESSVTVAMMQRVTSYSGDDFRMQPPAKT